MEKGNINYNLTFTLYFFLRNIQNSFLNHVESQKSPQNMEFGVIQ